MHFIHNFGEKRSCGFFLEESPEIALLTGFIHIIHIAILPFSHGERPIFKGVLLCYNEPR